MASKEFPLAVTDLFKGQTRREILQYCFSDDSDLVLPGDDGYDETWIRKAEIDSVTTVSKEAVRQNLPTLVKFGVLEVRDPDAQIPHYRLADTDVVRLLSDVTNGVETCSMLFESRARRNMIDWFLDQADPDQSYSMNKISKQADMNANTVSNHIDVLVETGIVDAVDGTRGTEYQLAESEMVQFLQTLNGLLVAAYQSG